MDDLLERLQRRGWRLTAQRRAVVEALNGENVHRTAEEVLERAHRLRPDVSRATVYNTLSELVAMGEVAEVAPVGRSTRYDPNAAHPHHHLLCVDCGDLVDVHVDLSDDLRPDNEALGGFEVTRVELVFSGSCSSCRG